MLGSGDAGSRLVFELSQFLAQSCRFGAILCRLGMVLGGRDAAGRIEKLGDGVVFAFAGMFELVGKIVLVLCVAFQSGNAALKILDVGPALSAGDGSIGDGGVGGVPISRAANLQHIFESVVAPRRLPRSADMRYQVTALASSGFTPWPN
jgi:hypothetical protein